MTGTPPQKRTVHEATVAREAVLKVRMAEIAERIEEAADTLRRLPDKHKSYLAASERGTWPTTIMTYWEAFSLARETPKTAVRMRLPPPGARQVDRMDAVMDWMLWLGKQDAREMKVVWLCCGERKRLSTVSILMGIHRNWVREQRDSGLRRLATYIDQQKHAA